MVLSIFAALFLAGFAALYGDTDPREWQRVSVQDLWSQCKYSDVSRIRLVWATGLYFNQICIMAMTRPVGFLKDGKQPQKWTCPTCDYF